MRIALDMKKDADENAMNEEYAREIKYVRKQDIGKKDRETMAMDTSHMSPETKQFWKLERRDVMRRRFFCDNGPSNTDWLNDQNH
ncbi:OTU-like cysteine protease family protein [Prunus dulcis]|uniref:OTU-like cysteine protease family protein n=1 Tax=Prunus dulcis TaxID=3755 RepID=A0A5H2XSV0_PRUDU|nr:OTU-like cysteine protease family protein [Prunus dulcis]